MEVENKLSSVGDEKTTLAVKAFKKNSQLTSSNIARKILRVPWFSKASSSLKNEGTWTTTPDPINPVQAGFTRPRKS